MHYSLKCLSTGAVLTDELLPLSNPAAQVPAFLRATYNKREFKPGTADAGIYRFADWLPIRRTLEGSSAPTTYRSEGLAERVGLKNLFITFSGYWPERNALMRTGTFKECEAFSVCGRMPANYDKTLVVASAGNTARAFIRVCSENNIPLLVVVPERNLPNIWSVGPVGANVRVVAAGGDSDYSDAIELSGIFASLPGFAAEGGAKNVARRDGMGTTVLSAVEEIGEIPHHYFQAVGSGTGAIAAWEANLRLLEAGDYGDRTMRLHVSQNLPFTPIHLAWKKQSREIPSMPEASARRLIRRISAKVLANRNPPYALTGGLYDALYETHGTTAAVGNVAAARAARIFRRLEGADIAPAAAVAVADLMRRARTGLIKEDEIVMLNVTGGGYKGIHRSEDIRLVVPDAVVHRENFHPEDVAKIARELF
ncbi:MAG: cysteate synthase [Spirochaetales bacterium]